MKAEKPILRKLFLEGDFYLASVLACCLTKLVLRHRYASEASDPEKNKVRLCHVLGAFAGDVVQL